MVLCEAPLSPAALPLMLLLPWAAQPMCLCCLCCASLQLLLAEEAQVATHLLKKMLPLEVSAEPAVSSCSISQQHEASSSPAAPPAAGAKD